MILTQILNLVAVVNDRDDCCQALTYCYHVQLLYAPASTPAPATHYTTVVTTTHALRSHRTNHKQQTSRSRGGARIGGEDSWLSGGTHYCCILLRQVRTHAQQAKQQRLSLLVWLISHHYFYYARPPTACSLRLLEAAITKQPGSKEAARRANHGQPRLHHCHHFF